MTVIAAREFTILNKAYRAGRMCLWKKWLNSQRLPRCPGDQDQDLVPRPSNLGYRIFLKTIERTRSDGQYWIDAIPVVTQQLALRAKPQSTDSIT